MKKNHYSRLSMMLQAVLAFSTFGLSQTIFGVEAIDSIAVRNTNASQAWTIFEDFYKRLKKDEQDDGVHDVYSSGMTCAPKFTFNDFKKLIEKDSLQSFVSHAVSESIKNLLNQLSYNRDVYNISLYWGRECAGHNRDKLEHLLEEEAVATWPNMNSKFYHSYQKHRSLDASLARPLQFKDYCNMYLHSGAWDPNNINVKPDQRPSLESRGSRPMSNDFSSIIHHYNLLHSHTENITDDPNTIMERCKNYYNDRFDNLSGQILEHLKTIKENASKGQTAEIIDLNRLLEQAEWFLNREESKKNNVAVTSAKNLKENILLQKNLTQNLTSPVPVQTKALDELITPLEHYKEYRRTVLIDVNRLWNTFYASENGSKMAHDVPHKNWTGHTSFPNALCDTCDR